MEGFIAPSRRGDGGVGVTPAAEKVNENRGRDVSMKGAAGGVTKGCLKEEGSFALVIEANRRPRCVFGTHGASAFTAPVIGDQGQARGYLIAALDGLIAIIGSHFVSGLVEP